MPGTEELLEKIKTQNEETITKFKGELTSLIDEHKNGSISKEEFDKKYESLNEKLKDFDPEKYNEFKSKIKELEEVNLKQGEEITKLKDNSINNGGAKNSLENAIKKCLDSQAYKAFAESNGKIKASFELKDVSITDDYDPASRVHITSRNSRVVDHPTPVRLNVRDLMNVTPIDLPYLAFLQVYDWDKNSNVVAENGMLQQSAFKVKEETVGTKRLGTFVSLSKRMLKSTRFILRHLSTVLPAQVKYTEDFQLLFGDGEGQNVKGLYKDAQDFTATINTTITGAAGSVASVETYNAGTQTIINFTNEQTQLQNGDTITIAGAGASYDGSYKVVLISTKRALITQPFTATASTAAWTYETNNQFKDTIRTAQQLDVIKVAKTLVTQQQYMATGIVLNPTDVTLMETLKGNDDHYLSMERMENGVLMIGGLPVVETTAMPAGKFLVGDFVLGAELAEYSGLVLEFLESTDEKLTNTVKAAVYEEILFPIYNKFMFVSGDFDTAIQAINV